MKFRWKRWLHVLWVTAAALTVIAILLVQTGVAARWARRGVIAQVEKMTGGRVELRNSGSR